MTGIPYIEDKFVQDNTNFLQLIQALKEAFSMDTTEVPLRHHHDFPNPKEGVESTLLLMPAWNPGNEAGVKIVTVSPNNGKYDLPAIQGTYVYMDAHKGSVKAILDAKQLTAKRTAAASALAAKYLAKMNASTMLMIGTGALAENLIRAHATVRPLQKIYVWGRSLEKAFNVKDLLSSDGLEIIPVSTVEEVISKVDIISCATLSAIPLVHGHHLVPGQHIDLVGAYKNNTREADDAAIKKSSVYVDTFQGGLKESGDIVIPLKSGILKESEICADLFELCSGRQKGRRSETEITLFKSVGHALEDLAAASHYTNLYMNSVNENNL